MNPGGGHQITNSGFGSLAIRGNNYSANTHFQFNVQANTTYTFSVYAMGSLGTDLTLFGHHGFNPPANNQLVQSAQVSKTFTFLKITSSRDMKLYLQQMLLLEQVDIDSPHISMEHILTSGEHCTRGGRRSKSIYFHRRHNPGKSRLLNIGSYSGIISSNSSKTITGFYTVSADAVNLAYIKIKQR